MYKKVVSILADTKEKIYVSENAQLIAEWDFVRNQDKSPYELLIGSNKKAWWNCSICGFSWEAQIQKRAVRNQGCPLCAKIKSKAKQDELNALKIKEKGSIADKYPDLVKDWDDERNAKTPYEFLESSNQSVFWKCYKCGHKWEARIQKRTIRGQGCPLCAKDKLLSKQDELYKKRLLEEGSLADNHPELLVEWDFQKNHTMPTEYLSHSNKTVFWKCSKCGNEWNARINTRVKGSGCLKCARTIGKETLLANLIAEKGSLADNNPALATEWHPTKNENLTPSQVMENTNKSVWWLCRTCAYEWKTSVSNRTLGRGCPRCAAKSNQYSLSKPIQGINDLESQCPELAAEWHPIKNGSLTPNEVARSARKKVWCPLCRSPHVIIFQHLNSCLAKIYLAFPHMPIHPYHADADVTGRRCVVH